MKPRLYRATMLPILAVAVFAVVASILTQADAVKAQSGEDIFLPIVIGRGDPNIYVDFSLLIEIPDEMALEVIHVINSNRTLLPEGINEFVVTSMRSFDEWTRLMLVPSYVVEQHWEVPFGSEEIVELLVFEDADKYVAAMRRNSQFEELARNVPQEFIDYSGFLAIKAAEADSVDHKFPWTAGQSWKVGTLGMHPGWGPHAVDFIPDASTNQATDYAVLASASGELDELCGPGTWQDDAEQMVVTVRHSDGNQTGYLHIDARRFDRSLLGQHVPRGRFIGQLYDGRAGGGNGWKFDTPCGRGDVTHLHFIVPSITTRFEEIEISTIANNTGKYYTSSNRRIDENETCDDPTPDDDEIVAFSRKGYEGFCKHFGIGEHDEDDLGDLDEDIESIRVGSDVKVRLFEKTDLNDPHEDYDSDVEDLGNWNDRAQSLRVERKSSTPTCRDPNPTQVTAFAETHYKDDDCHTFDVGRFNESILKNYRLDADIESLKVGADVEVILFAGTDFNLEQQSFDSSTGDIGDWQNRAQSLEVKRKSQPSPVCPGPELLEPTNGASLADPNIFFRWNPLRNCAFDGYDFRIKDTASMDSGGAVISEQWVDSGAETVDAIPDTWLGKDLYWGVRAASAAHGAEWSVGRFRVHHPYDLNSDGLVNILDAIELITYIFQDIADAARYDINHDGKVDIFDVLHLITYIFQENPTDDSLALTSASRPGPSESDPGVSKTDGSNAKQAFTTQDVQSDHFELTATIPSREKVMGVAADGSSAQIWITTWHEEWIRGYNISTPTDPQLIAEHAVGDAFVLQDIEIAGDTAAVSLPVAAIDNTVKSEVRIVRRDPLDPRTLNELGVLTWDTDSTNVALAEGIALTGPNHDFLFVANARQGINVFDIFDPENPRPAGNYPTNGYAADIFVDGNIAYVVDDVDGLTILELTYQTPSRGQGSVGFSRVAAYGNASPLVSVYIMRNLAFLTDKNNAVHVLDVSRPTAPVHLDTVAVSSEVRSVAAIDTHLLVGTRAEGLLVYDISDPNSISLSEVLPLSGPLRQITVEGAFVYIAADTAGVHILRHVERVPHAEVIEISDRNPCGSTVAVELTGFLPLHQLTVRSDYEEVPCGSNESSQGSWEGPYGQATDIDGTVRLEFNNGGYGVYTFTFTDATGYSASVTFQTDAPVAPTADFSASVTSGQAPLTVQFSDASTGEIANYQWDFGDGSGSTQRNPAHTYASAGVYAVALTVSGPGGSDTRTRANYITVAAPPDDPAPVAPTADFWGTPTTGNAPLTVQFYDRSLGDIDSWEWSYGDGMVASGQFVSHTYYDPGTYTVTLEVSGSGGSDSYERVAYITVNDANTNPPPALPPAEPGPTSVFLPLMRR